MVSLVDADNSDVNGWTDGEHSDNVQLTFASSTGRVYAEHFNLSLSNVFSAAWTAPDVNSGDVSFYASGLGANGNNGDGGDHAPTPIRVTFPESATSSTNNANTDINIVLYPNPATDKILIEGDINGSSITISQQGQLIQIVKAND